MARRCRGGESGAARQLPPAQARSARRPAVVDPDAPRQLCRAALPRLGLKCGRPQIGTAARGRPPCPPHFRRRLGSRHHGRLCERWIPPPQPWPTARGGRCPGGGARPARPRRCQPPALRLSSACSPAGRPRPGPRGAPAGEDRAGVHCYLRVRRAGPAWAPPWRARLAGRSHPPASALFAKSQAVFASNAEVNKVSSLRRLVADAAWRVDAREPALVGRHARRGSLLKAAAQLELPRFRTAGRARPHVLLHRRHRHRRPGQDHPWAQGHGQDFAVGESARPWRPTDPGGRREAARRLHAVAEALFARFSRRRAPLCKAARAA